VIYKRNRRYAGHHRNLWCTGIHPQRGCYIHVI
jgi:hypothetical protein